ncbi:MAG TPA: ATP-binding cassette domain-containing protein, partial [Tepidisphaeraceae bacterium]|nr:ATP-binding cassette domain-containing protein [Tepidisphaeraceae bacterium]
MAGLRKTTWLVGVILPLRGGVAQADGFRGGVSNVISVSQLTKLYGQHLAVDHISFEVAKGQIVGFLGPNGAGKSTTLRMLTCFLPPTSGGANVNGHDIFHE